MDSTTKFRPDGTPCQFTRQVNCNPGFVYLVYGTAHDAYKIGYTADLKKRLRSLRSEYRDRLTDGIEIVHTISTSDNYRLARELHNRFEALNMGGGMAEWFALGEAEIAYIKSLEAVDYPAEYETLNVGEVAFYEPPSSYDRLRVEIRAFEGNQVQVQQVRTFWKGSPCRSGDAHWYVGSPYWVDEDRIEVSR